MTKIKDKIVWITGASSGIGEALAYELAKNGAILILSSRRREELERVKNKCINPLKVAVITIDLNKSHTLDEAYGKAKSVYGKIDILINNGGITQRSTALETTMEVDRKIMEVNYFASIQLTKNVIKDMKKTGVGHIVSVSSVAGKIGTPLRTAYAASKHALHGFYDALRAELTNDNIQVTLICPGYINTNISFNAMTGTGALYNKQSVAQAKGISVEYCARKIVKAIRTNKREYYIAGFKERAGLFLKKLAPGILAKLVVSKNNI